MFRAPGIGFFEVTDEIRADREFARNRLYPFLESTGWVKFTPGGCSLTIQGSDEVEHQRRSDADIIEMKTNRIKYLKRMREIKDETGLNKEMYELGDELGFSNQLTDLIVLYLKDKGLLESHGIGAVVKITEAGRSFLTQT